MLCLQRVNDHRNERFSQGSMVGFSPPAQPLRCHGGRCQRGSQREVRHQPDCAAECGPVLCLQRANDHRNEHFRQGSRVGFSPPAQPLQCHERPLPMREATRGAPLGAWCSGVRIGVGHATGWYHRNERFRQGSRVGFSPPAQPLHWRERPLPTRESTRGAPLIALCSGVRVGVVLAAGK